MAAWESRPALSGPMCQGRELCKRRTPASATQRKRWNACEWASLDTAHGRTVACAHWWHIISLRLALSFWSRLRGGACTTNKCNSQRATTHKSERTDRGGWTTGRSGGAHLAWSAERESAGRASRSASAVRRRERLALPFRGAQRGRGAVCGEHTHTPSRCAVRDRQAYGTCTCVYAMYKCVWRVKCGV